jgi:hypothetical protein
MIAGSPRRQRWTTDPIADACLPRDAHHETSQILIRSSGGIRRHAMVRWFQIPDFRP